MSYTFDKFSDEKDFDFELNKQKFIDNEEANMRFIDALGNCYGILNVSRQFLPMVKQVYEFPGVLLIKRIINLFNESNKT